MKKGGKEKRLDYRISYRLGLKRIETVGKKERSLCWIEQQRALRMQRAEREGIDEKQSFNGAPDTTPKSKLADIKSLVRTAVSQKLSPFLLNASEKRAPKTRGNKIQSGTHL